MNERKKLFELPRTTVVKLDSANPWLIHSRQGFTWQQMLFSNVCSAVMGAAWFFAFLWR